jgi:hypothetical protein
MPEYRKFFIFYGKIEPRNNEIYNKYFSTQMKIFINLVWSLKYQGIYGNIQRNSHFPDSRLGRTDVDDSLCQEEVTTLSMVFIMFIFITCI